MENAIEVKNLKIRYKSFKKLSIKSSIFKFKKNEVEVFEAVKGISFSVPKGQILGIVGKNGSGKSTLLRALAGVFSADEGEINIFDNSISLLALGVGFHKKLSGRENILLAGMLFGFTDDEVREKMDEIMALLDKLIK